MSHLATQNTQEDVTLLETIK
uniref:Uncharacterized protein n=1 Tax=Arundo donax TaxID=35708 RepID=A0A0A8ZZD8_ARUDO